VEAKEAEGAEEATAEEAMATSEEGLAKAQEGWGNEQREEEEEESAITIAAYYQEGAELANVRRLLQLANEELETAARARKKAEDMAKAAKAEAEATRARAEMERAKASVTLHRSKNPNMESSRIAARVVGETSTTVETAVEAPSARADARPSLQQGAPKSVWRQVREPVFAVALATQSFTPERHTSGLGVLTGDMLKLHGAIHNGWCLASSARGVGRVPMDALQVTFAFNDAPLPPNGFEWPEMPSHTTSRHCTGDEGEVADALMLVFGSAYEEMSQMLAQRSGGTVIDMETLAGVAANETSEEAAMFRATQEIGGIAPMKVCLPLLQQVIERGRAPFILSGFPRIGSQVKQLVATVGALGLVICADEASGAANANLRNFFSHQGTPIFEVPSLSVAYVDAALEAAMPRKYGGTASFCETLRDDPAKLEAAILACVRATRPGPARLVLVEHDPAAPDELSLRVGEKVIVAIAPPPHIKTVPSGWLVARNQHGSFGIVPEDKLLDEEDVEGESPEIVVHAIEVSVERKFVWLDLDSQASAVRVLKAVERIQERLELGEESLLTEHESPLPVEHAEVMSNICTIQTRIQTSDSESQREACATRGQLQLSIKVNHRECQ
jgi:hypothetical protein